MKKIFSLFAAVLFAGSMMAADLLSIDFTQGQGNWTINDVNKDTLDFVWAQSNQYGMKASAYTTAAHATEAWLISPEIDLTAAESASMAINHAMNKGNNTTLAVLATMDGSNWNEVELSAWPAGTNWTFIDATADLSAYAGHNIQIAFKYVSTTSNCPTWEIKTVVISDGDAPVVEEADVVFTGDDFLGQGTSSTGSPVSATKNGVTFSCDKGYNDDAHATLRCYKNGVITITSETEQIGKLVFQFYQTYTGDLETEVVVNANEWTYTLTNQARIEKLEIYFGEYEPIDPVVLEPITVAEALEIAQALTPEKGKSATTVDKYAVQGFVVGISTKNENTFYLADETGAYGEFEAYKCSSVDYEVAEGDLVIVTGKIQHYWGESASSGEYHSYEISNGTLVHVYGQGIENVTLTEKAQKVIVDGAIYIVRDGKMFNAQGAQVR